MPPPRSCPRRGKATLTIVTSSWISAKPMLVAAWLQFARPPRCATSWAKTMSSRSPARKLLIDKRWGRQRRCGMAAMTFAAPRGLRRSDSLRSRKHRGRLTPRPLRGRSAANNDGTGRPRVAAFRGGRPVAQLSDLGVMGLAVMGANLARNAARKGFGVALYNRHGERTDKLVEEFGHEGRFTPDEGHRRLRGGAEQAARHDHHGEGWQTRRRRHRRTRAAS